MSSSGDNVTASSLADKRNELKEILPKSGLVYSERGGLVEVLCKPKILPLKSAVLEQLQKIERAGDDGENGDESKKWNYNQLTTLLDYYLETLIWFENLFKKTQCAYIVFMHCRTSQYISYTYTLYTNWRIVIIIISIIMI